MIYLSINFIQNTRGAYKMQTDRRSIAYEMVLTVPCAQKNKQNTEAGDVKS